jgi:putative GTP pyrophosphokinase
MTGSLRIIEKQLTEEIKNVLDKLGIHYRIFSRPKDTASIEEKSQRKEGEGEPYGRISDEVPKLMQDLIGIRVVTYFKDDVELVKEVLTDKLNVCDKMIDEDQATVFKPKRTNIICKFNDVQTQIFNEALKSGNYQFIKLVDNTFELQLRTVLSEGWHEVDHSLRYKCKTDWEGHGESERMLNGIYANLETNDIVLKNLFNELAYKHYKSKNWSGLIRNKFRLQFKQKPLSKELIKVFNDNLELGKTLSKINREEALLRIFKSGISFPINLNNVIYVLNKLYIKSELIFELTPEPLTNILNDELGSE